MTAPSPGLPLAVTMGEPAGIGGEIALAAWRERDRAELPPFFLIDDPARLEMVARQAGLDVPLRVVDDPGEAPAVFGEALPVIVEALPVGVRPGQPEAANVPAVLSSIRRAARMVLDGQAAAMVTAPVQKDVLYGAGFDYPGQTEFLAALAGTAAPGGAAPGVIEPGAPVMMLACPGLRVVPVTVHLSLRQALDSLDAARIVACAGIAARALDRDFGIARPRLVVAALNPHAGEAGTLGREEAEIIEPAVREIVAGGIDARGPLPADSLFHPRARARYDAAICMYHDQALVPLKTVDFDRGVNITLGLPLIRTSPDHGTALDIAGQGRARADSMIAALGAAATMAVNRARAGAR